MTQQFSRAIQFLHKRKGKLPRQTQEEFAKKSIRITDADVVHASDISNAGSVHPLLRSTNQKVVGVSDFNENTLDVGQNVAVDKIKLGYIMKAKDYVGSPASVKYSSDYASFPAELLNSKFLIKQDGKTLLSLPVERFTHAAKSTKVQGEEDTYHLDTPILLIEKKIIEMVIEFNPDQAMDESVGRHFFQVRLMGAQTMPK
ncbi:hypothetical protein [Persicobacter sp. CCB-QB2]|uniref:hypothetical protein n=1 Tax=Persicobacter sp. CCB-QB2 TaxID=1561025 RepID=UPI0006A967B0|nr:hypothetical protein [Persicobacter sp. CCB-QB2]